MCLERRGLLSARVRKDDAAVGVCERYYSRVDLVYVERWQEHLMQDSPTKKVSFGLGWLISEI